jgi:hypothetical protein
MLSTKSPKKEISLEHLTEVGTQYEFPGGTYAYTTTTDMVYQFNKPVSF